jgi:3-hydroxyisobutyrate dehydrogenase-like beta-hydroxyacid dehydrogenase
MIERIGIIGLGKMGLPITRHLLAAGHSVSAYDVDAARIAGAQGLGAVACSSPSEVAGQSELVIIVVGFDSEVLDVLNSAQGIFSGANDGLVIAIASTVKPELMDEIAGLARRTGRRISVLDVPLCRGEPAAEDGQLLMLAGGDKAAFEKCLPAFATFASDIRHLGGLGAGQVGKLVNNLILWACVCANHEGLKLGTALGLDGEALREALLLSSARNWALETWHLPRPMPWAEKDMAIVMQEADQCRLSLPMCGVVREVIKGVKIEMGLVPPKPRK